MSKISAFATLQDSLGREQAQVIATFIDEAKREDNTELVTKSVLKQELHEWELRINNRIQWTGFIQIITTVAALIALSKLF